MGDATPRCHALPAGCAAVPGVCVGRGHRGNAGSSVNRPHPIGGISDRSNRE